MNWSHTTSRSHETTADAIRRKIGRSIVVAVLICSKRPRRKQKMKFGGFALLLIVCYSSDGDMCGFRGAAAAVKPN